MKFRSLLIGAVGMAGALFASGAMANPLAKSQIYDPPTSAVIEALAPDHNVAVGMKATIELMKVAKIDKAVIDTTGSPPDKKSGMAAIPGPKSLDMKVDIALMPGTAPPNLAGLGTEDVANALGNDICALGTIPPLIASATDTIGAPALYVAMTTSTARSAASTPLEVGARSLS